MFAWFLAVVVWIGANQPQLRANAIGDFRRAVFAKAVWWHPSARADYVYYVVNAILHGALFGSLIVSMNWVAVTSVKVLTDLFGAVSGESDMSVAKLTLTVFFFLTYDFGRFIAHFALHHVPALWIIHKVHHSAEVLTPTTSMRAHPIELIWMASVPAVTAGIPIGITIYLVGSDPGIVLIGGLHVLIFFYSCSQPHFCQSGAAPDSSQSTTRPIRQERRLCPDDMGLAVRNAVRSERARDVFVRTGGQLGARLSQLAWDVSETTRRLFPTHNTALALTIDDR